MSSKTPTPKTTDSPIQPPHGRDPRRRRKAFGLFAVLAVATLAGHLVSRRIAAGPERGSGSGVPIVTAGSGPMQLSARVDRGAVLQGGDGLVKVELKLTAEDRRAEQTLRLPTDLVVVLDRSGSMSGEKIEVAKAAVLELLGRLGQGDRFALVPYSNGAEVAVPLSPVTPGNQQRWRQRVRGIGTGGGTAMSAGLDAALDLTDEPVSGRAARIVLVSDGLANQGDATFTGLTGRAVRAARREAPLTAVGVGLDFDEHLMGALADAGSGNYYYLEEAAGLAAVFARELEATQETVVSGLAVTLEPAPGVELVDAGGYPLEHHGTTVTFRPGSLFAGQERQVWVTLRVPAGSVGEQPLGRFVARFRDREVERAVVLDALPRIACVASEERFLESLDDDAWSAAVAGDEYHQLEEQVAIHVKQGRREAALSAIAAYQAKNEQLNRAVESTKVEESLTAAGELAGEVRDAFEGAEQERKQNILSKMRQLHAWDGRRQGAKKTAPPQPEKP